MKAFRNGFTPFHSTNNTKIEFAASPHPTFIYWVMIASEYATSTQLRKEKIHQGNIGFGASTRLGLIAFLLAICHQSVGI